MFYIEQNYGNDGFATFVKLLRELAKTDYHYLDLSNNMTMMFISARCRVSKEMLEKIIADLVELGKFDKVLWTENRIIWCQDFIDNIQDAYSKRNNKCITYDGLLHLLHGLGIRKLSKLPTTVPDNPHSIVEYSIVEKKEKEKKVSSPVLKIKNKCPLPDDSPQEWEKYVRKITEPEPYTTSKGKTVTIIPHSTMMTMSEDKLTDHMVFAQQAGAYGLEREFAMALEDIRQANLAIDEDLNPMQECDEHGNIITRK